MNQAPHERLLVALDTPETERARELIGRLRGRVGGFKIGLQLFAAAGPEMVREARESGAEVFLDLKLHDIPNTVAGAAAEIGRLGVRYFTMHALGGARMIRAGVEAADEAASGAGFEPPVALAVTVLTSHDDAELQRVGVGGACAEAVRRLVGVAREGGAGGVVCSPLELPAVRELFPTGVLVVPGIRPSGGRVGADDQSRTATPKSAVDRGADRLVIGRPITRADDPAAAADAIAREIECR